MKRDVDLLRQIMLALEQGKSPYVGGYYPDAVHFHLRLLRQAGWVDLCDGAVAAITWVGAGFLDLARNDYLWDKAKGHVHARLGYVGPDLILEVLRMWQRDEVEVDVPPPSEAGVGGLDFRGHGAN